jgi:hypothetical protein
MTLEFLPENDFERVLLRVTDGLNQVRWDWSTTGFVRLEMEGSCANTDPSVISQHRADDTSPINRGGKQRGTREHRPAREILM